jgi:hypothetical protein
MDVEDRKGSYLIGIITFQTRKGKGLDLAKLHEAIKATRLSGRTRSAVKYFDLTAPGEVTVNGKDTLLTVSGTTQKFALGDDPKAKPKKGEQTPFQRLQAALAEGKKVTSVTGRVQGWSGGWPQVLKEDPAAKKLPLLMVTDFQTAKK